MKELYELERGCIQEGQLAGCIATMEAMLQKAKDPNQNAGMLDLLKNCLMDAHNQMHQLMAALEPGWRLELVDDDTIRKLQLKKIKANEALKEQLKMNKTTFTPVEWAKLNIDKTAWYTYYVTTNGRKYRFVAALDANGIDLDTRITAMLTIFKEQQKGVLEMTQLASDGKRVDNTFVKMLMNIMPVAFSDRTYPSLILQAIVNRLEDCKNRKWVASD